VTYSDSNHIIIFVDSNLYGRGNSGNGVLRTTDGGATWHFITIYDGPSQSGASMYWDFSSSPQSASMPDSMNAYCYAKEWWIDATHDGGLTWEIDTNAFVFGTYWYFIKMYSAARGRAISSDFLYTVGTTDSGRHFYTIGNAPGSFIDAVFLDTSEYWVSYEEVPWDTFGNIMEHTTDAGNTWSSDTILDSIPPFYGFSSITQTPDPRRFYVLFAWHGYSWMKPTPFSDDFAETTDDGVTWRIDSTLGSGVIEALAAPAPNQLWALLHPAGATTVSYSPDDGHTWCADPSVTADTITGMIWPDAQHGFITAVHNDSLVIYRFVSSPSGVALPTPSIAPVSIYPNPATRSFTISSGTPSSIIRLFDMLGREVLGGRLDARGGATLDVSSLPAGIYSIVGDAGGTRTVVLGKVAVEGR